MQDSSTVYTEVLANHCLYHFHLSTKFVDGLTYQPLAKQNNTQRQVYWCINTEAVSQQPQTDWQLGAVFVGKPRGLK